jgi:hypothetical protein
MGAIVPPEHVHGKHSLDSMARSLKPLRQYHPYPGYMEGPRNSSPGPASAPTTNQPMQQSTHATTVVFPRALPTHLKPTAFSMVAYLYPS